jgi:hypothetical protein
LFTPVAAAVRIEIVALTAFTMAGAWLLASRFTRSHAICAFVAIAWALNGRWALQTTVGRGWHFQYAWMAWAFYFFDRAIDDTAPSNARRARDVVLASVCLAMIVYMGGIYPLPHTAVALGIYSVSLAVSHRSARPLLTLGAVGALGAALACPKLLPIAVNLGRFPRLIESSEVFDPGSLVQALTEPAHQDDPWWRQGIVEGQWHEWGMYVGWWVLLVLVVGSLLANGVREKAMLWAGSAMTLLALGNFHKYAPWTLLHELSIFRSQHVPSRWLYPAMLPFACATASTADRLLRRFVLRINTRFVVEVALVAVVGWLAFDMEEVARGSLKKMFTIAPPVTPESTAPFVTRQHVPAALDYEPTAWFPPSLQNIYANFGTIDCDTAAGLVVGGARTDNRRLPGLGARGQGDPEYHGEAFVAEGTGTAEMVDWTPNAMVVHVRGATPGEHLVLNQNWDAGWRADGHGALNWNDAVAVTLDSNEQTVSFRYVPRMFWVGVVVALLSGGLAIGVLEGLRRARV